MLSDIETYFHLAEEESDVAQRATLLQEIEREIAAADTYVSDLETVTLLSGENDRLNAIMTIKPGAGGMESQDWAEMLLRMYLRWAEQKGFRATVMDSDARRRRGTEIRDRARRGRKRFRISFHRERRASPDPHLAV